MKKPCSISDKAFLFELRISQISYLHQDGLEYRRCLHLGR